MLTKYTLTTLFIGFLFLGLNAQGIKTPLADKVQNEIIPEAPSENHTWVKGHWEFINGKYQWQDGQYIEVKEGHKWQDGYWERNQKTGLWVFNEGYWQKSGANIDFSNSQKNTMSISTNTSKNPTVSGTNTEKMGLSIQVGGTPKQD
ncbi:MAG: hypothetical protein KDC82_06815 [Bacteroidetes bacterium]|nr:hypothetical protein [Bacteroidota bacterium]